MNLYSKLSGHGIGKIPGLYNTYLKLQHLKYRNKDIVINGIKYPLIHDAVSNRRILSYYNQGHEPYVTQYFKDNVKVGDRCVDVGTNFGYFTLLFSKLVGDNGKVFGFEPDCGPYKALQTNINYNAITNTTVLPIAINDNYTIDKLIKFDIDFIKIDVEGAEVEVLKGMVNHLEQDNNLQIVCEVHPTLILENGDTVGELDRLIKKYGFNVYSLEDSDSLPVEISDVEHTNRVYLFTKD